MTSSSIILLLLVNEQANLEHQLLNVAPLSEVLISTFASFSDAFATNEIVEFQKQIGSFCASF